MSRFRSALWGWAGPGLVALLLVAGCQSPDTKPAAAPAPFKLNRQKSVEFTPAEEEFDQRRASAEAAGRTRPSLRPADGMAEGELYALPKFTVTRKGFLNFGLSVVTNTEVALGGPIEWMRVGVVIPGSPAAREGLFTGIEILAIDAVPVAHLNREAMLHLLFERESGERARLLVYSRAFGPLPRFVTLGTNPAR